MIDTSTVGDDLQVAEGTGPTQPWSVDPAPEKERWLAAAVDQEVAA